MTILCPQEFYEATEFARNIEEILSTAIFHAKDENTRKELEKKRGLAMRSLMSCFGSRAFSDARDTECPYFPDGSEIHFADGSVSTVLDCKAAGKSLVRDTFIYSDFCPHSFFFREEWLDRDTREVVYIYDRCWYLFKDGRTQYDVDRLEEGTLKDIVNLEKEISRVFSAEEAEKATRDGTPVREAMIRRGGMCGGIIFHYDYVNGKRAEWGSWSTHT